MTSSPVFCTFKPEVFKSRASKIEKNKLCSFEDIHKHEQVEVYNSKEKVLTSLNINCHVLAKNKEAKNPEDAFKNTCVEDVFSPKPFTSRNRMFAKFGSRRVRVDWFICCQVQEPTMEFHCFQIRSTPHPLQYEKDFFFPTLQFCEKLYDSCDFLDLSQLDTMNDILTYFEEKRYPQFRFVDPNVVTKLCPLIDEILKHCDLPDWDFLFDNKTFLQASVHNS